MEQETIDTLYTLGIPHLVRIISQLPTDQDWVTKQVYMILKAQADRELVQLENKKVEKEALSADLATKIK